MTVSNKSHQGKEQEGQRLDREKTERRNSPRLTPRLCLDDRMNC